MNWGGTKPVWDAVGCPTQGHRSHLSLHLSLYLGQPGAGWFLMDRRAYLADHFFAMRKNKHTTTLFGRAAPMSYS